MTDKFFEFGPPGSWRSGYLGEGEHNEKNGCPVAIRGRYRSTGVIIKAPGTYPLGTLLHAQQGGWFWLSDGKGLWAGISKDGPTGGNVLGFINLQRYSQDTYEMLERVDGIGAPIAVSPQPRPSSSWNGKCPKCGKGTYQGFISMEHEGGGCP